MLFRNSPLRTISAVFFLLVLFTFSKAASGQASLAGEDSESLVVGSESYTVLRDAIDPQQWYYVPNYPRLYVRKVAGQDEPEFSLLKYQFKDPKDPQKALEGGILQFSTTLDIPQSDLLNLRQQIATKKGLKVDALRLVALPPKSATVAVYSPKDGTLISGDSFGNGNAPTFASQKMVFSIPLTNVGTDVYDALIKGSTGVPLAITITYGGLTPPAGFTIHVNWDMVYHHYSTDSIFAAKASYFGLVGASYRSERQDVYNELTQDGSIKVEVVEGSGFKMADIDKYLQPILQKLNEGMVDNLKPPSQIDPAKAKDPDAGGYFGSTGYSVAIKSETDRRHGSEDVSFFVRQYQERSTIAAGFIGIGSYSSEVQSRLITIVPKGAWDKAYFLMPTMFDDPRLGIQGADLELSLKNGDDKFDSQVFKWSKSDWKGKDNQTRSVAFFPLAGLREKLGESAYKNLNFGLEMKIIQRDTVVQVKRTIPVFDGETALASLPEIVEKVGFDGGGATWNRIDSKSPLIAIHISLSSGDFSISDTIRPVTVDGKWAPPDVWFALLPKASNPSTSIIPKLTFVKNDSETVEWKYNGQDLRKLPIAADLKDIVLTDSDWGWPKK